MKDTTPSWYLEHLKRIFPMAKQPKYKQTAVIHIGKDFIGLHEGKPAFFAYQEGLQAQPYMLMPGTEISIEGEGRISVRNNEEILVELYPREGLKIKQIFQPGEIQTLGRLTETLLDAVKKE
jgi:hypothetical protein